MITVEVLFDSKIHHFCTPDNTLMHVVMEHNENTIKTITYRLIQRQHVFVYRVVSFSFFETRPKTQPIYTTDHDHDTGVCLYYCVGSFRLGVLIVVVVVVSRDLGLGLG